MNRRFYTLLTLVLAASLALAEDAALEWHTLKADAAPPVARTSDALPLSDQENAAAWEPYAPMTDEFKVDTLDAEKWWDHNPHWTGRIPGWFDPANVSVHDGRLHLTMRAAEPPPEAREDGFHTYTCAAVQSKGTVRYGYFEVKAKPMPSLGSSSFWFYKHTPERWTEIDVFELCGAGKFSRRIHMNVHVFHTPESDKHWMKPGVFTAPAPLDDAFHVYGLEWTPEVIRFYFDGHLVREGPNTHWHQPLTLNFDSETMPDWFGLPEPGTLPTTYEVEYVRAWKRLSDGELAPAQDKQSP